MGRNGCDAGGRNRSPWGAGSVGVSKGAVAGGRAFCVLGVHLCAGGRKAGPEGAWVVVCVEKARAGAGGK